ncbi:pentapeptide repeat-containing protein [Lentzea atacamensis]|uniref:pentapeptide repeat-containing protein n=1 Tax=Lentzea atacamensis TaxID=531938 RepID=UPI0011B62A2F|nr:pentapeptide repeat-containing protein [Lentzea atacamensis]
MPRRHEGVDEELLRRAYRTHDRPRRARLVALLLVGLAVAAAVWQLIRLHLVPSWDDLQRWWPALAAVAALVVAAVLWWRTRPVGSPSSPGSSSSSRESRWARISGIVTAITAVLALLFTALSLAATRDQIEVARQGQINDRYTRAVDQVGAQGPENLHRRIGGIYALERIAADSPHDHQSTVVEVLSAFIRSTSPRPKNGTCGETPVDVLAAFTVLARRNVTLDPKPMVIDLRDTCLRAARAPQGNLTGMSFVGADLTGANLNAARLGLTSFSKATMVEVRLDTADMTDGFVFCEDADFTRATFASAKFGSADFSGSTFTDATFDHADLGHTDFSGARLTGAKHTDTKSGNAKKDAATIDAWW